jgi:hypothetical protein
VTIWILLALPVAALGWAVVDLFLLKRGIAMEWQGQVYRLRLSSWLPRLLGSGGTTIGDEIHIAGPSVSAWLLGHEFAHVIRAKKVGRFRYLWRYLTSKAFRTSEELACNLWADLHHKEPHPKWVASSIRKGGA